MVMIPKGVFFLLFKFPGLCKGVGDMINGRILPCEIKYDAKCAFVLSEGYFSDLTMCITLVP